MKIRKIIMRISAALIMCLSTLAGMYLSGEEAHAAGESGYTEAKDGVAVVNEYVEIDGQLLKNLGYGSGFFIGNEGEDPQYLITNHHVIQNYLDYGAGQWATMKDDAGEEHLLKSYIRVYYDYEDSVEAYVVGFDEVADVAVLRLEKPTDKRTPLALCPPAEDMTGVRVYALGYPSISDNLAIDSVTTWGPEDLTITSGIISRFVTASGTGVHNIQIDVAISAGNSGGPLVNEEGMVLGINTKSVKEINYAINIDEVIRLLKLHDVPYTLGSDTGTDTSSEEIAVSDEEEEGKKDDGDAAESAPKPVQEPNVQATNGKDTKGAGAMPLVVSLIVLAAISVAVAVYVRNKNKTNLQKNSAASQAVPSTAPAASNISKALPKASDDSGYRLQGVSGALGERRFLISQKHPLTLGRNPEACNVVYPPDTAGVSGLHCQVWYDHGNIYIKDIGSNHGTFNAAGAKLAVNQPIMLRSGESFSLGSPKETMVLVKKGGN